MSNFDNWKTTQRVNVAGEWAQGQLDRMNYSQVICELQGRGYEWDNQPTHEEAEKILYEALIEEYYEMRS